MDLNNKVAIITGGARGLGRGFAEALIQRGANGDRYSKELQACVEIPDEKYWVCDISLEFFTTDIYILASVEKVVLADVLISAGLQTVNELAKSYAPGKLMFVQCDVSKNEDLEKLFKTVKSQYGHIDIMVNNAGIGDEYNWRKMVDINLAGVIHGTMLALQYMNADNGGRGGLIVNVGSTAGLVPIPLEPIYSATKYGVVGFSRSVAGRTFETTEQNVRVTCLCPSFTLTPLVQVALDNSEGFAELVGSVGLMKPERVVEGFMKLVDDRDNNGGVLSVIPESITYKHPRHLRGKL